MPYLVSKELVLRLGTSDLVGLTKPWRTFCVGTMKGYYRFLSVEMALSDYLLVAHELCVQ